MDKNENSNCVLELKLPKGKVNKNNFEECMKLSKPIAPIPSGSIKHKFCDKGPFKRTLAHQVIETQSKFNYQNILGELMYTYIIYRPDIGYAITALSKFLLKPSAFHYRLLQGLAKYLRSIITCMGYTFNCPSTRYNLRYTLVW